MNRTYFLLSMLVGSVLGGGSAWASGPTTCPATQHAEARAIPAAALMPPSLDALVEERVSPVEFQAKPGSYAPLPSPAGNRMSPEWDIATAEAVNGWPGWTSSGPYGVYWGGDSWWWPTFGESVLVRSPSGVYWYRGPAAVTRQGGIMYPAPGAWPAPDMVPGYGQVPGGAVVGGANRDRWPGFDPRR